MKWPLIPKEQPPSGAASPSLTNCDETRAVSWEQARAALSALPQGNVSILETVPNPS